jgi:YD repeat-containing protein
MVAGPSGTWVVTCNARTILTFDSNGRLISHVDPNGDGLMIAYPSSSQIVVTDDAGRALTLTLSSSRVVQATDSASRTVQYTYNGAGELTDVIDTEGGHAQFTYDASHRMITMRSPRFYGDTTTVPSPVVTTHYDGSGRVDWQTDELGHQTTFNYTTVPGSTIVTDPEGHAIQYKYLYGMLVERVDGYGTTGAATWTYTYDPISTVVAATVDPNGRTWTQTADANGNVTSVEDPLGRTRTTTYNAFGDPTTITDAAGVTTTLTYDTTGNPTGTSTPWLQGPPATTQHTTLTHGDLANPGDVTSVVDAVGETWLYGYDTYGNPITRHDPLGNITRACFDTIGRTTEAPRIQWRAGSPDSGCCWGLW